MAKKVTELPEALALANNDFLMVIDVSDGLSKKIQKTNLGSGLGDLVGPAGATDNVLPRFDTATGKLLQDGQTIEDDAGNVTVAGTLVVTGGYAHSARHITGGADEVDGDQVDIDWTPSNYTPAATPAEVTSVDHLSAHLYGIDQELPIKVPPVVAGATLSTTSAYHNRVTECTNVAGCTVTVNNTSANPGTLMTFWASVTGQAVTLVAGAGVTLEPVEGKTLASGGGGHAISVFFITASRCLLIGSFA